MRALTCLGFLLLFTGCGEGSQDRGAVLEPAGVVVLEESEDEPIGQPVHVAIHDDGRIALIDRLNPGVSIFSSSGDGLQTLGSAGGGPGEIESARLAVFWPEGRAGVVGEGAQPGVHLFDVESGEYLETVLLQSTPSTVTAVADGFLFGSLNFASETSVTELNISTTRERVFGPIPTDYDAGSPLSGIFHRVFAAPIGGGAIVIGFEPLGDLVLLGETEDTLPIPHTRRRGMPEDLEDRILQAMGRAYEEVFAQGSVLSFMASIADGRVLLVHQDLAPELPAVPEGVFLNIVDANDREACVDVHVPFDPNAPATFAWDGDRLGVLQQEIDSTGEAPAVLRWYTVDQTACNWIPF